MKFNVLIAEDEKVMHEILISMVEMIFLKDYPFLDLNISAVKNGKDALSVTQETRQDIILSDIIMPVMDGLEFIRRVRLFDKSVPILVLSALSREEDVNEIMQSGASNYTTKPLNGKLFTAQIKVFVDFYLRRQNKYNHSAINLFSKNIYKRKMEFLIEGEDDLIEFWEYLIKSIFEKYRIEKVLQFVYDIELFMLKKGIANNLILEESDNNFYLTMSEMDKLEDEIISEMIQGHVLGELDYKNDGFFISLIMHKTNDDIKPETNIQASKNVSSGTKKDTKYNELKEMMMSDIRYSIHEEILPEDFLAELDPTYEDKIENFLDDLSLLSVSIFDLEEQDGRDHKECIQDIIKHLDTFNHIINTLGLFNVINRSFEALIDFLSSLDEEVLKNSEKRVLLSKMLQGLINDLESWINMIFIDRNATDIHYFDASFAENSLSVITTFTDSDSEDDDIYEEDDDLEFF